MTPHRPNTPAERLPPRADRRMSIPDLNTEAARPNRLLVGAILVLCIAMTAGVVTIWRAGLWRPGQVSAAFAQRERAGHEVVVAALNAARTYMTQGEWGKAEAVLMQAAEEFPLDQEIRIAYGEALLAQRRYKESYEQYAKALTIGPRDHALEFVAGQVASSAEMHEAAADHFSLAQRGDPFNSSYPLMLGMVERRLGRADAAKASLLRAANIDPQNAFAWGMLADIALSENNVNLAIQHVGKARTIQPESREWRLVEARARKRLNEPERALLLLNSLESSQKREPAVVRLIAECFGMLNRHADAAEVWAQGLEANPGDATIAMEAALAYDRAGNKARALEFARRARTLGSEGAARLIERLGG